jgi:DNA-binding CsgD family transcriptional regulator
MVDRWPLTGRTEELRVISEALSVDEHGGMVVAGQAGVGKTRLARAAADAASRAGWSVHRIAGTATGQPVTLGAFARWVDATDSSPLTLARKVFAALAEDAGDAPLLLFVDDAHLLDDLSALIVHQLVLQNATNVIATMRTGAPAPDAVRALWKNGLLRRLELQPLSHDECSELLQTVLDGPVRPSCAERMWTLSRGNVLFLHHLVEHERDSGRLIIVDGQWHWAGTPSVSPSLVELVETQIGAVPDDVRDVVDLVAISEPVDQSLLAAIADPDAIEAAERLGLISSTATDLVCVGHPLYGEIRLRQCGPMRLKRLRGRVAATMAQSPSADPLRLGLLWLDSDLPPDAEILSLAAAISASRLDLGLAERLARAAVEAQPMPSTKLQLAHILYLQEKGQETEDLLNTLTPQELSTHDFIDGVTLRAANLMFPLRDLDAFRAVIDDAVLLGDESRNQSLLTLRAIGEAMAARPAETVETMAGVDYGQLDSYGRVLGYSAETIALGDLGRTARASERAAAGYRELIASPQESFAASPGLAEFHAYALLAAGWVDEAVAIAEQGHRQYAGLPGMSQSMAVAGLGMTALGSGDLIAAHRHLDSARESFGDYGEVSGLFYRFRILHTEVLARSGDHDAAAAAMEVTRQSRHPAYEYVESSYLLASAWVAAAAGRVTEAHALSRQAAEFARSHGQLAREVLALQTAGQFGDTGGADRLAELTTKVEGPRAPLAARYARALAAGDAVALGAVSRDFEAMGDKLAAADAAAQASTSHRLAGQRGSALTANARAVQLAKDCGDAVSPALAAARVPLPFTRREHEIALLLSRGLSNRDIAKATSLSIRTVEGHIYQASTKAGVSSRSELSALVQQFNGAEIVSKC